MAYQRKTRDEYELRINYGYGHGYETVTTEESHKEIRKRFKEYQENEPGYPRKIVKKRIPLC